MKELLGVALILIIGYILWKKGIIRIKIASYRKYTHFYNQNSCRASYQLFDGFDYFYFRFNKNLSIKMKYSVKVTKGTLTLIVLNKKGESEDKVFSKTFSDDEAGEFQFLTEAKYHSVKLVGDYTQGSCSVEFEPFV